MLDVKVKVYNKCKYEQGSEKIAEVEYTNIQGYELKIIEDQEIYNMGFDEVDEYKEYLTLTLEDGETATFRNSHVDMFRI